MHNDHKVRYYKVTLDIMLPKTSAYVKSYDGQTKWMCFLIEDDDIFFPFGFSFTNIHSSQDNRGRGRLSL